MYYLTHVEMTWHVCVIKILFDFIFMLHYVMLFLFIYLLGLLDSESATVAIYVSHRIEVEVY